MKRRLISPLILTFLLLPFPGTELEGQAIPSQAPIFQIAMVLDASSSGSLKTLKAHNEVSGVSAQTTKVPPRLVRGEAPTYPEDARLSRVQGSLVVTGIIDPQGQLQDLEVQGNKSQVMGRFFRDSTFEALRHWRFAPGTVNDQAVPVSLRLIVRYRLVPRVR